MTKAGSWIVAAALAVLAATVGVAQQEQPSGVRPWTSGRQR